MTTQTLSPGQARKLALHAQGLPPSSPKGTARATTLAAIEHLGYIQIDTIAVIERAHHHTLWNRNPRYSPLQLDQLLAERQVFEYWSHAAAYLPMRDFRFSLPRKHALATGQQSHWGSRDKRLMREVLRRIREEGPLMARDFEHSGGKVTDWSRKPAKRALEHLFMEGELMVPGRRHFHKVYDLTERVLPSGVDTRKPSDEDYSRFLIQGFLRAHGLGRVTEIAHLLKGMKPRVRHALQEMHLAGEVEQVAVGSHTFFTTTDALEHLRTPLMRRKLKILSPFDNLVIHRQRLRDLFAFDYLIECYVPKAKRRHGYFVLPILWRGEFVARMDCTADRQRAVLDIHSLTLESSLTDIEGFCAALCHELNVFMRFCACNRLCLHRSDPAKYAKRLQKALQPLTYPDQSNSQALAFSGKRD